MAPEESLTDAHLTEPLCNGTGCVLWRGWSAVHRKLIAKVFPKNNNTRPVYEHEVAIVGSLKHRHIIRYVGSCETSDSLVILTKDGGENLFDYISDHGDLSEDSLRGMAKAMCEALSYCHSQQLCHGDVKLENFVIGANGRVRLLDFGLAETIPAGGSATPCGSTFYLPPEVIRGKRHGLEIDVWALGITIFALATREFPFCTEDEYSNVIDILGEDPDLDALNGRYSAPLAEMIRSMLQKNPAERPTIREVLISSWFGEGNL
jgi:serine/threonine protein kinase